MAYYNTYNGLGVTLTKKSDTKKRITGFAARKAATTTAAIVQPITGGHVVAAQRAAQQAATLPPATTPTQDTKPAKTWKDYLVWIALGGVVAFGAYKMLTGKKKRR
jgi:hypothetical protein